MIVFSIAFQQRPSVICHEQTVVPFNVTYIVLSLFLYHPVVIIYLTTLDHIVVASHCSHITQCHIHVYHILTVNHQSHHSGISQVILVTISAITHSGISQFILVPSVQDNQFKLYHILDHGSKFNKH